MQIKLILLAALELLRGIFKPSNTKLLQQEIKKQGEELEELKRIVAQAHAAQLKKYTES